MNNGVGIKAAEKWRVFQQKTSVTKGHRKSLQVKPGKRSNGGAISTFLCTVRDVLVKQAVTQNWFWTTSLSALSKSWRGLFLLAALFAISGCEHASVNSKDIEHGKYDKTPLSNGPHEFIVNQVRLWYRAAGSNHKNNVPVVYLHGGPGQGSQSFATLVGPRLEPALKIIYFDQRGSGRSERPFNNEYSVPILVDDIEALRLQLDIPQINIIAHSFGGVLALEYAAKYPSSVNKMVIAAGLSDAPSSMSELCSRLSQADTLAYGRALEHSNTEICDPFAAYDGEQKDQFIASNMFPDMQVLSRLSNADTADGMRNTGELSKAIFAQGITQYQFKQHNKVKAVVLVVAGKMDYQIGLAPQRALAEQLPSASISIYDNSGHFMFFR